MLISKLLIKDDMLNQQEIHATDLLGLQIVINPQNGDVVIQCAGPIVSVNYLIKKDKAQEFFDAFQECANAWKSQQSRIIIPSLVKN